MRIVTFIIALTTFLLVSCTSGSKKATHHNDTVGIAQAAKPSDTNLISKTPCEPSEPLIYQHNAFSSYTEDRMRGSGVVSFQLDINDRLDIYYLDEAVFGYLVYNEDETFYMLSMPKKLVARRVVPEADFAQFDFDAEPVESDNQYLFIYANGEKLMVKKADVKYTYSKWDDYVRSQPVSLKSCNLLDAAAQHPDMLFEVIELKGDQIKIKSSKECAGPDVPFKPVEGWLAWKKGNSLLVNLSACN